MPRTITRRPVAAVVALVALLAAVALAVTARTAPSAKAYSGPVLSTTERGLCIKRGTGEPRSLWLVEATGLCPEPYWGPASLEDAFGITLPKAAVAKPAVTAGPAVEGKAPVLSLNATPSTTGIPVKWTAADAPGDDTVVGYQVRYRRTTVTTWTTAPDLANVLTMTVEKLDPGVRYELQVRARYGTSAAGAYGPWSNSVFSTTDDLPSPSGS